MLSNVKTNFRCLAKQHYQGNIHFALKYRSKTEMIILEQLIRHSVAGRAGGNFSPLNFLQKNKIFLAKDFNLLLSSSLSSFKQT